MRLHSRGKFTSIAPQIKRQFSSFGLCLLQLFWREPANQMPSDRHQDVLSLTDLIGQILQRARDSFSLTSFLGRARFGLAVTVGHGLTVALTGGVPGARSENLLRATEVSV